MNDNLNLDAQRVSLLKEHHSSVNCQTESTQTFNSIVIFLLMHPAIKRSTINIGTTGLHKSSFHLKK